MDRRCLIETLGPAALCLAVSTFLLLTTQILRIAEAAFGRGLTLADFAMVLLLIMPRLLIFTLPISTLVGVAAGLGRLSDDREVLALEAAGMNPLGLWRGPMTVAVLGALLAGLLSLQGEPWALRALSNRLASLVSRNLVLSLDPGVIHEEIPGAVIYSAAPPPPPEGAGSEGNLGASEGLLSEVFIELDRGSRKASVVAKRARLLPQPNNRLRLEVEDGELALFDKNRGDAPELPALSRTRFKRGSVVLDISRTFARRVRFIGALDVQGPHALARTIEISQGQAKIKALQVYHRRLALPFGCLALGILALPLGLASRAGGRPRRGLGVLLGILAVAFYFVAGRVAEAAAAAGSLPLWLAPWLPSLVLVVIGLGLLERRRRQ